LFFCELATGGSSRGEPADGFLNHEEIEILEDLPVDCPVDAKPLICSETSWFKNPEDRNPPCPPHLHGKKTWPSQLDGIADRVGLGWSVDFR
jgi:hypothetical protein